MGDNAIMQDNIMNAFGIGMPELAAACKVTRTTPYNWRRKCKHYRTRGLYRLFILSQAAEIWRELQNKTSSKKYKSKLFGDQLLKDKITAK